MRLEGNTLTLGETRSLILHGLTARGKPMREHVDIEATTGRSRNSHGRRGNTVRRLECNWELMIFYVAPATEDFAIRLNSEDPDELKTAFNRLLRDMMGTMEQWDSQSKN